LIPFFGKLEVVVTVPLPPDHPQRAALETVALNCPVQKSLNPELEIPVTFSWGMFCEKAA
jgi:putative redox protein